jgi:hypothetical protein
MTGARCPSDLALEGHLADRERSPVAAHVAACASCAARIERMEAEGEHFRRFVFPATVDEVEAAAAPRPWWRARAWMVPVPAVLLSVMALVVLLRPQPPDGPADDYLGTKGGGQGALALTVFLGDAAGARALADGERVPASGQLRFSVRPERPCRLWVVSADVSGEVSRIFPSDGDGGARFEQGGALPGGAVLDGKTGPERFFALCAPGELELAAVRRAVSAAVGAGERGVRSVRVIPGLPDGTSQGSVLIEKE